MVNLSIAKCSDNATRIPSRSTQVCKTIHLRSTHLMWSLCTAVRQAPVLVVTSSIKIKVHERSSYDSKLACLQVLLTQPLIICLLWPLCSSSACFSAPSGCSSGLDEEALRRACIFDQMQRPCTRLASSCRGPAQDLRGGQRLRTQLVLVTLAESACMPPLCMV